MLFNSIGFLFGFLPITYLVFWRLQTQNQRYVWLVVTGYAFYACWNYEFCALMAFSTLVSYFAGLGFLRWDHDARLRKWCLVAPVVVDLALLGFFKYAGLLSSSARTLTNALGVAPLLPALEITLPIGISFYTFHTISYIVDSYRRTIRPTRNLFEFACYVSLFCQLVAGPIVRFRQIEKDLSEVGTTGRMRYWERGCSFFVIGMLKKVLLADVIAAVIDPALANHQTLSTAGAWVVMVGYSLQLYFDFSGYSDMAVGLGYLFGLRIPQNFASPYKATNPSDFWQRWHISLSSCMRDYVYIPLGGNQHHVTRNLLLTMLIGGLWHGANWTFVAWGAYHGALLIAYKATNRGFDRLPTWAQRGTTFVLVLVGWVFFRATSFGMAGDLLSKMFWPTVGTPFPGDGTLLALVALGLWIVQAQPNTWELSHQFRPRTALLLGTGFAASLAMTYAFRLSPFLYFQF